MAGNRVISAVLTLKDKDFGTTAQKSASHMKDLERRTKHTSNTVGRFGKSASSAFKSVAVGAAGMVTAIGITKGLAKGFDMMKSSIGSAMDRIDVMEQFERTMTVITGSTEKTKEALEKTRDAVTGTGYGLDTAAKSVQNFVTRGMDIEKATDTMAIWGDAVAFYGDGSNEQYESVADAIGKMYSSGKVGMDQMNRLTDAGIDGVGMYAKATGMSVAQVQKSMTKGNITSTEFIDVVGKAMTEGANGVQKIAGAAKTAGSSWKNTFANMRASVTRGVENIIMNLDKMLENKGLPNMREMVANFGKKFESAIKGAAAYIPMIADGIMLMYEKSKPALDWLKNVAFPELKEKLQGVVEGARPALEWLKDVAFPQIVEGVTIAVGKFGEFYNFITTNMPAIIPILAGVTGGIYAFRLGTMLVSAATTAWSVATGIANTAMMILNGTMLLSPMTWVAIGIGLLIAAGVALYMNWDVVKEKAQLLWDKTKLVAAGIGAAFKVAFDMVKTAVGSSINFVIGKINSMIDVINKIPGVNIPIVAKVDWGAAEGGSAPAGKATRTGALASYAVGTNRIKEDTVAQVHKGEMIVPARQSQNLREQGVTIDNVDKPRSKVVAASGNSKSTNSFVININAQDRSTKDIVNELVPMLQMRLANV